MSRSRRPAAATPPPRRLPRLTDRLPLGRSGLEVSPYCLGRLAVDRPELVSAAFDAGINFFFLTTDLHWFIYSSQREGLRQLLARRRGVRDRIVIAAVSYVEDHFARGACHELLAAAPELGHIDVLVAGGLQPHDAMPRLYGLRERLRDDAHGARSIGAAFHDRKAAASAHLHEMVDVAFIRYNPRHTGATRDVFPTLAADSSTLLFNFTSMSGRLAPADWRRLRLGRDHWRPDSTDYYRFALSAPHMDGILGQIGHERELRALARALERGPLDEDEQRYLVNLCRLADGEVVYERSG